MSEDNNVAGLLDALLENHREVLIGAAHGQDAVWANMCRVYKIPEDECAALRYFVHQHYPTAGRPVTRPSVVE